MRSQNLERICPDIHVLTDLRWSVRVGYRRAAVSATSLVLAFSYVVAACGDDTVAVPSGVIVPDVVGGTPYDDFFHHMGRASSCGLDSIELWGGTTKKNTIAYRRTIDGHKEYLVIGAYKNAPANTRLALQELQQNIVKKECKTPPFSAARLHLKTTPDAFAFSASSHQTSYERSQARSPGEAT